MALKKSLNKTKNNNGNEKDYNKFPVGLIILIVFGGILILLNFIGLISSILSPTLKVIQAGPFLIDSPALYYTLVILGLIINTIILIGLLMRKNWARILLIIYLGFCIFNLLISFIGLLINPSIIGQLYNMQKSINPSSSIFMTEELFNTITWASIIIASVIMIPVYALIIIYLIRIKKYFK